MEITLTGKLYALGLFHTLFEMREIAMDQGKPIEVLTKAMVQINDAMDLQVGPEYRVYLEPEVIRMLLENLVITKEILGGFLEDDEEE